MVFFPFFKDFLDFFGSSVKLRFSILDGFESFEVNLEGKIRRSDHFLSFWGLAVVVGGGLIPFDLLGVWKRLPRKAIATTLTPSFC